MKNRFERAMVLLVFFLMPIPASADCWRLPNGQVMTTSAGSTPPAKGAQHIQCSVATQQQQAQQKQQQLTQQQAQQKQQQLTQQQAQQKQQQLAQQQAQQKQQFAQQQAQKKQQQIALQQAPQKQPGLVQQQAAAKPQQNSYQLSPSIGLSPAVSTPSVATPTKNTQKPADSQPQQATQRWITSCGPSSGGKIKQHAIHAFAQAYEITQAMTNGISFNAACDAHDSCYGAVGSKATRYECDKQFASIVNEICKGAVISRNGCIDQGQAFFELIRSKGGDAFCAARGLKPKCAGSS